MVEFEKWSAWRSGAILATQAVTIAFAIMLVTSTSIVAKADNSMTLMEAIFDGNLESVKSLLDKGADVNAKMEGGVTPLMVASVQGNLEVANLLLDRGTDINAKTEKGNTALDFAGYKGSFEMVKLLKAHGAK